MLVDDHGGPAILGEPIVPEGGLGVHQGDVGEFLEQPRFGFVDGNLEQPDHFLVLGATDHAAIDDAGFHPEARLRQMLQGIAGGQRVGIRVIVHQDEQRREGVTTQIQKIQQPLAVIHGIGLVFSWFGHWMMPTVRTRRRQSASGLGPGLLDQT